MLKSDQIKAKRDVKVTAAKLILDAATDAAPLSAEQRTAVTAILAEIDVLNGDIKLNQTIEALAVDAPSMDPADRIPAIVPANAVVTPKVEYVRSGPLKYFKTEKDAYDAGQFLMATVYGNTKGIAYCKANGIRIVRDSSNEGTNSAGGYLVPTVLESAIIDLREEYGVFRQIARVQTMSSNVVNRARRAGGVTAYPVIEGAAITESSKSWNQVGLTAKKWGVLTRYSSEVAEDAIIDIAQDLAEEIGYAFAVSEDGAGFSGDGTSTYHGVVGLYKKFFDANVATFIGAVSAAATHNLFSEIDGDDLDNLMAVLPLYARRNAKFYCSPQFKSLVFDAITRAAGGNTKVEVAGKMLEAVYGSGTAGALIFAKAYPGRNVPNFFADDATALADIKANAAL